MADRDALKEELEALQIALKTEEDGYVYYTESSRRTKHPVARKFLLSVAGDEMVHIELIKKFYTTMEKTSGTGVVELPRASHDYRERMKTVFEEAMKELKGKMEVEIGILDVYRHSMDLETKAAEFYKQHRDATKFDQIRKFYDWLFLFESEHYRMFSDTLAYLKNPEQWYQEFEKSIFEG